MEIEKVANLSPTERFLYWIKERHSIYLKRKAGEPKPWTNDEVLQNFFFTNPYRENDKTTVWFRENVREPLRDDPAVLFATVCFRWFNFIPTGELLIQEDLLTNWKPKTAKKLLRDRKKIFTGAFMINSPPREKKLDAICRRVTNVWKGRHPLIDSWHEEITMEDVHRVLMEFEGLGGFMAYEIVCDLRYTFFLEGAPDKMTWCNPGPGCIRGLMRIAGEEIENKSNATSPPKPKDWLDRMKSLLKKSQKVLSKMPPFEMREIEHSLCEFDKYERARIGDGRLKRKYPG